MTTNKSHDDDDDDVDFEKWNPLEEAYLNPEINSYDVGPGAVFDKKLQPAALANKSRIKAGKAKDARIYLVIRNAPKEFNCKGILNLCRLYGKVTDVRYLQNGNLYFVDVESVADITNILSNLEVNDYGFKVEIGRSSNKPKVIPNNNNIEIDYKPEISNESPKINYKDRSIYVTDAKIECFKLQTESFTSDMKRFMQKTKLNDQRIKLIKDDAHELERQGLIENIRMLALKSNYKFRNGRAIPDEKTNDKEYNDNNCIVCNITTQKCCSRCSTTYCSTECQKKDWEKHRYICGKSVEVIKGFLKMIIKAGDINKEFPTIAAAIRTDQNAKCFIDFYDEQLKLHDMNYLKIYQDDLNLTIERRKKLAMNFPKFYKSIIENDAVKATNEIMMPANNDNVKITAINKLNVVYITSIEYSNEIIYNGIINTLQEDAKYFDKFKSLPKPGDIVVTKVLNRYNRALILNNNNNKRIRIQYIDYGDIDYRSFDDLLMPTKYYRNLPRLALPVHLKNIPDLYLLEDVLKIMYVHADNISFTLNYKQDDINENGIYNVLLYDQGNCLNDLLLKMNEIIEPDMTSVIFFDNLKTINLPTGNNISLFIVDNSNLNIGYISCTTKQCIIEMQRFYNDLKDYGEKCLAQYYTPNLNELCIVKYGIKNEWFRGRCLETVGDGYPTIHLIDYGAIVAIKIDNIRRYPGRFTYPVLTYDYELKCLQNDISINEKTVKVLENLLKPGMIIKCDNVTRIDEMSYTIIIEKLERALKAGGLIQ